MLLAHCAILRRKSKVWRRGWLCFFFGNCLWAAFPAEAQSLANSRDSNAPSALLSLAQVKEIAFERNWDLLTAKSGIDSATAQLIVTKEYPNPTASVTTAYLSTHGEGTSEG